MYVHYCDIITVFVKVIIYTVHVVQLCTMYIYMHMYQVHVLQVKEYINKQ